MSSVKNENKGFGARKWWVLATVSVIVFMIMLDATVVNIAVPSILKDFKAGLTEIEWVLNAYTLVFAALLITMGRLGDMFGRRRMFITGVIIFGFGSAACGFAPSAGALIAARVFQALGAAIAMPATLSLVSVTFPPEQRGTAIGVWGAVTGLALAVGPTLGGFITESLTWRYIFFLNIPLAVLAVPLAIWAIRESREQGAHKLDIPGVFLSVATLLSFTYGMIEGPSKGWGDPLIIGLLGGSAVGLAAFIIWERISKHPLMNMNLFKNMTFSAGNAVGAILMFAMMGVFFMMPLFMQAILHYSAVKTGIALTPMSLAIMLSAPLSGRLSDRIGAKWLVFSGLLVAGISIFWMGFLSLETTAASLIGPFLLAGLAMGLIMSPMSSAVMSSAPKEEAGEASGILSTMRQIGSVMGIAILGAVLQGAITTNMVIAVNSVNALPAPAKTKIVKLVEDSKSGGMMGGGVKLNMDTLKKTVSEADMAPITVAAIKDAVKKLPLPAQKMFTDQVISDYAAGKTPVMGAPGAKPPAYMIEFGKNVGAGVASRMKAIGTEMGINAQNAFVDSLNYTLKIASLICFLGAGLALLLRKREEEEASAAFESV